MPKAKTGLFGEVVESSKRMRKMTKLKKAESHLRLFARSPPPDERRSTSKNRTTAKSNQLNITMAKPASAETTAKRKKKKNGAHTIEPSKANMIIRKALEILKKEENERKRSEEKETKDKLERINKSKVYANFVRHKNEKVTKTNGSGITLDSKEKWAWGVDQRKFTLKRNCSEKALNLKGLTVHEANDTNSTHRRHSASKERKISNTQAASSMEFAKKSSIVKLDRKDVSAGKRKEEVVQSKPKKAKVDRKAKHSEDDSHWKPALAAGACFSTQTSGGLKVKHTAAKTKSMYGMSAEFDKVSAAARARDKLIERLEGQLKLQLLKHQSPPLCISKRSKSKERTYLIDPVTGKPRRFKKAKRARKRERHIGKVQLTKRGNEPGGKAAEERLDMLSKYPGDKKINSSASSDLQSEDEHDKEVYHQKATLHSENREVISQKNRIKDIAEPKNIQKVSRRETEGSKQDTEPSQNIYQGQAFTNQDMIKSIPKNINQPISNSDKQKLVSEKSEQIITTKFEGSLRLDGNQPESDIDLVGRQSLFQTIASILLASNSQNGTK